MTATEEALQSTRIAAQAAADKFGKNIVAFDVSDQLAITDVFLVVSGNTDRQVSAIIDNVEEQLHRAGRKPTRREGERENRWVLLDYIDLVVHVQQGEERDLYSLERLWKDCPRIELDLDEGPAESEDEFSAAAAQQSWVTDESEESAMADDIEAAEEVWDEEGGLVDPDVDTDTPVPDELDDRAAAEVGESDSPSAQA